MGGAILNNQSSGTGGAKGGNASPMMSLQDLLFSSLGTHPSGGAQLPSPTQNPINQPMLQSSGGSPASLRPVPSQHMQQPSPIMSPVSQPMAPAAGSSSRGGK